MKICDLIDTDGIPGVSNPIYAHGSFGTVDGDAEFFRTEINNTVVYEYTSSSLRLRSELTEKEDRVFVRKDSLQNLSDKPLDIYRLVSRFRLDGNMYDVYTQYSGWQHESRGYWQPLVTQIRTAATGIRTCDSAAPMMAMRNGYTGKTTVFHLIPNAQWSMTAKKIARNDKELVILETGFFDEGLHLTVEAGETIELPIMIFFSANNQIDFDAYKLHRVYNELYPRNTLPIAYNTWMDLYDGLDFNTLLSRADVCAEMGIEAFVIDAGWFGTSSQSWSRSVGDWFEQKDGRLDSRLGEISAYVRSKGLIFGLWFEPERAYKTSKAAIEHPDFFIQAGNDLLLDFANAEAVDYIYKAISSQIEKYNIGFLKFDFNATVPTDTTGSAFYRYMQGQRDFISRLRKKYPNLHITNCASGGYRMELGQGTMFDSFWISDNQGPYEGIRILKDTLKRMPTALIERWNVQKYCEGFPDYNIRPKLSGKMIHTNNGTWDFLIGVDTSFSEAFVKGGIMGFSCNIESFPNEYRLRWSNIIAEYKNERDFYKTATARILVDSEQIIAIEYADTELNTCIVQLYTKTVYANELVVFPVVDPRKNYIYGDTELNGTDISEHGIKIDSLKDNCCVTLKLTVR